MRLCCAALWESEAKRTAREQREREREFIRTYFKTGVKLPRVQSFRRGYIDGAVVERVGVERIKCNMTRWR